MQKPNKFNAISRRFARWISAAAILTISAVTLPAFAVTSTTAANVSLIEFNSPTGGGIANTLILQTPDGTNFFAPIGLQGACSSQSQNTDTVKLWQSLAQVALLSGKNVRLYFNVCGGTNYITAMDLIQ